MSGKDVKIRASGGGEFDCYLAVPKTDAIVPAMVLASAVHGVDADIRAIADEFAADGYIVAAPDLFWRTVPGPLARGDDRTKTRSQPRLERIKSGEADLTDTLTFLRTLPQFNGRAAVMGFCYGGPYAIIGPKRLGYAAGVSCHGTQMLDYIGEIEGVSAPICIIWGDRDHAAAHQRHLAAELLRDIDDGLQPVNRGAEAGNEQAALGAIENVFEARTHGAFGIRIAGPVRIGGIGEQEQDAPLAVIRQSMQIEKIVVDHDAFVKMHAEDRMATDKLKEGIEGFSAALEKLEAFLAKRLTELEAVTAQ